MHHCGAAARGVRRREQGGQRRGEAGGAKAAVAGGEVGWRGGFERAVLFPKKRCLLAMEYYQKRRENPRMDAGEARENKGAAHTLQTTLPHLLHPPTKSLAQVPTLPLTKCPASPRICHFWPSGFRAARPRWWVCASFSHRRVDCRRRVRYCRRL